MHLAFQSITFLKDVTKSGNEERGTGNRERGSGNDRSAVSAIKIQNGGLKKVDSEPRNTCSKVHLLSHSGVATVPYGYFLKMPSGRSSVLPSLKPHSPFSTVINRENSRSFITQHKQK